MNVYMVCHKVSGEKRASGSGRSFWMRKHVAEDALDAIPSFVRHNFEVLEFVLVRKDLHDALLERRGLNVSDL